MDDGGQPAEDTLARAAVHGEFGAFEPARLARGPAQELTGEWTDWVRALDEAP